MTRKFPLHAALCCALLLAGCSEDTTPPTSPGDGQPAPVAGVQITPGASVLPVGQSRTLNASTVDAAGRLLTGRAVSWTTSNEAVATVEGNGKVTAVSGGTATITATSEGKSGTATILVAAPVETVEVVMALDTIEAYQTQAMAAILRDAGEEVLTGREVIWSSSNPAVATIDPATGVLTGVDRGTVTITATSEGKSGTASRVVVIKYRSLSTGSMHACNVASGGIAWCWGLNGNQGRIGVPTLGEHSFSSVPVKVPGGHRFVQLETYGSTTCGVTMEGKGYCWGYNGWGALGTGASNPGQSYMPVAVAGGHTFKQMAAGAGHMCGLTTVGKVFCWGANGSGELGNGQRTSSATPVPAAPALTFASISGGSEYTCGIAVTGPAYCWGYDGLGNLGDGRPISHGNTYSLAPVTVAGGHGFKQVSAGQYHTCGLTNAGQGYCWGANGGRLGNGNTNSTSTPALVTGGYNFRSIAAGFVHTCAVTTSDEPYCWGGNGNGQLGLTLLNGSNVPVRAGGNIKVADISAANVATGSASYTCAISVDRLTTWCWGRNDVGQLGNGTTTSPAIVNEVPSIVQGQKPL